MDHLPPASEVHATNTAAHGNTTDARPHAAPAQEFNRNAFLVRRIEHTDVNNDTLHRAGEAPPRSEFAQFDERLKGDFVNFLKNYTGDLSRLANEPPPPPGTISPIGRRGYGSYTSMLDAVLDDPTHRYDKEIMKRLMEEHVDDRGVVQRRVINEAKLQHFLQEPEGWIITNQLIEDQAARAFFSMGLHAAMLPPGERNMIVQDNVVQLGIDQGVLNRLGDRMQRWLGQRALDTGGRTNAPQVVLAAANALPNWFPGRAQILNQVRNMAQTLTRGDVGVGLGAAAAGVGIGVGLAGGLELGAVAGAAALGGEALGIAWQRLMRDGVRVDLRQCGAALNSIRNNPLEVAYMKAMSGIDVEDYQANGNDIVRNPNRPASESIRDVQHDLLPEAMKLLYTRVEFYKQCGVPETQIDALPEQFIFLGNTRGEQEKTATVWQQRMAEEFNPNTTIGLPLEQRLQLFREARQRVMVHYLEEMVRHDATDHNRAETLTQSEQGLRVRALQVIGEKLTERADDGTLLTERRAPIQRNIEAINGANEHLQATQATIDTYQGAFRTLTQAREAYQRFPGATGNILADIRTREDLLNVPNGTIAAPPATPNIALRELIRDRAVDALFTASLNAFTAANPRVAPSEAQQTAWRRAAEGSQAAETRAIERERARIQGEVDTLTRMQENIRTAQEALSNTNDTVSAVSQEFQRFAQDFNMVDRVNDPAVVPPLLAPPNTLTLADLQTLSTDVILARINQAYTQGAGRTPPVAFGWPESQNARADRRQQLARMAVEARAQANPAFIRSTAEATPLTPATPGALRTAFDAVTGAGVSETQLLGFTNAEINALLGAAARTNAELNNARTAAQDRLNARMQAMRELSAENTERVTVLEEQSRNMTVTPEVQRLNLTTTVMNRQGEIFARAFDAGFFQDRFFNDTLVNAGGPRRDLTQSEQANPIPEGYVELMDTFFDYRNKPNRNALFTQITQVLPPDRLAELLDRRLTMPFNLNLGAPRNDLVAVMGEIRGRLRREGAPPPPPNSLSSFDIQQAFRDIINSVRDETLALT
jgi:hypothetical protein